MARSRMRPAAKKEPEAEPSRGRPPRPEAAERAEPQVEVGVVYEAIDEIARWPRNPKEHDLDAIESSMVRFGYTLPMVRDERTGRLVAGHGRLEVLLRMRNRGDPAPKRILVDSDGRWLAPVLLGVSFDTEEEAEAYLLVDNRSVEAGGWDRASLAEMLRDQLEHAPEDVSHLGWSADEIQRIVSEAESVERVNDPSDTEWVGMPEFEPAELPFRIIINFKDDAARHKYATEQGYVFTKKATRVWSCWWPTREREDLKSLKYERDERADE
jgi:hypothetical protein